MPNRENIEEQVADPITNLVSNAEPSEHRGLRRGFYRTVLPLQPSEPRKDLQKICEAWLAATGAKWVWLWLKHEDGEEGPWELTAVASRVGKTEEYIPSQKEFISIESKLSVAEFASGLGRPVFVDNIKTWSREFVDKTGIKRTHEVFAFRELESRGCLSVLAVPLLFSKQHTSEGGSPFSNIRNVCGLVCSHFDTYKTISELQDEESYQLMGHATESAIISSFAENQRRVLVKMDALATKYLTKEGSIVENRKDYLKEVIALIQWHLQVERVSVFYRTLLDENLIECIASTGLYLKGGSTRLTDGDLSTVRYKRGEGLTGEAYQTGDPYISKIGDCPTRPDETVNCKSSEFPNDDSLSKYKHSWVCYPISTASTTSEKEINLKPVGILRCVGNKFPLRGDLERNFDPILLQAIDFIASQLAPVLETMAIHIKRERYITIIKHDLYNPLRLLDAGVEAITDQVEEKLLPNNWENKMKFSLAMARNLAGGLSEKESFLKKPVSLANDILTPLMSGLRYFAQVENNMSIRFDDHIKMFPQVNVDRELVERAFMNLVVNAIKYGKRDTEIIISGEKTNADYRLHIKNEGIGIDEADREKIFIGEYRSPLAKRTKQGLGLGLKIARAAMEKNGGKLLLTNSASPTIFTLVFQK